MPMALDAARYTIYENMRGRPNAAIGHIERCSWCRGKAGVPRTGHCPTAFVLLAPVAFFGLGQELDSRLPSAMTLLTAPGRADAVASSRGDAFCNLTSRFHYSALEFSARVLMWLSYCDP